MKHSIGLKALFFVLVLTPALASACSFCRMKAAEAAAKSSASQRADSKSTSLTIKGGTAAKSSLTNPKTFFASIGNEDNGPKVDNRGRSLEESEISEVSGGYAQ